MNQTYHSLDASLFQVVDFLPHINDYCDVTDVQILALFLFYFYSILFHITVMTLNLTYESDHIYINLAWAGV